jgi:hypothetical protein
MSHDWQARRDRDLRQELTGNASVKLAVRKLLEKTSGFGLQTRRRLLTRSVRMTRGVAPRVHEALDACRSTLDFREPVEIYVQAAHDFQGFCAKSITSPLILGVSSRLLESFSDPELRFVIGHELGHAALDHFAIPMPSTATFEDVGGKLVDRPTQRVPVLDGLRFVEDDGVELDPREGVDVETQRTVGGDDDVVLGELLALLVAVGAAILDHF